MLERVLIISNYPYKVLFMSNNNVKDWGEFQKLAELHQLEDLLFVGKPSSCNVYMYIVAKCLRMTRTIPEY